MRWSSLSPVVFGGKGCWNLAGTLTPTDENALPLTPCVCLLPIGMTARRFARARPGWPKLSYDLRRPNSPRAHSLRARPAVGRSGDCPDNVRTTDDGYAAYRLQNDLPPSVPGTGNAGQGCGAGVLFRTIAPGGAGGRAPPTPPGWSMGDACPQQPDG